MVVPEAALVWLTLAEVPVREVKMPKTSANPTLSCAVPCALERPLVKAAFGAGTVTATVGGMVSTGGGVTKVKSP